MHLYYNDVSVDCSKKELIQRLFRRALKKNIKMPNASIFSFIILNLVQKAILDIYVTPAADIYIQEVIESCLCRVL